MSDEDRLPFSETKQMAILGHLLVNNDWFIQASPLLKGEWFANPKCARIFSIKFKKYQKHGIAPTFEEMLSNDEVLTEQPAEKAKLLETMRLANAKMGDFSLKVLSDEMDEWMHSVAFRKHCMSATALFNAKNTVKAYSLLNEMIRDINTKSFKGEEEEGFDNFIGEFAENEREYSSAMTFGLTSLDKLLTPKASSGSLLRGDSTVILAPVNTGKTSTLITVAVANIKLWKDVFLITHEGRPSDIKEKIRCCYLGMKADGLYRGYHESNEGKKALYMKLILEAHMVLKKHLTYIPMNRAGMTVEEVSSIVRRKQDERLASHKTGYDMLVNDYPAKLTSSTVSGAHSNKRHVDDYVYNYFVQLALENKWHSLSAIQSNREGSKNNKWFADRLLTMEDANESFGPMQTATNVITVNRDPVAKQNSRLTFYIDKSRSSETGIAVVCKTDFAKSTTHSDALGAVWYRGTDSYTDMVDNLLTTENDGKEVSQELYKSKSTSNKGTA
jgi:hypothetical protein